jgi:hypothetical protein
MGRDQGQRSGRHGGHGDHWAADARVAVGDLIAAAAVAAAAELAQLRWLWAPVLLWACLAVAQAHLALRVRRHDRAGPH